MAFPRRRLLLMSHVLLRALLWYASNEPLDLCSDSDSTSQVETITQVKWLVSYDFWYLWRICSATPPLCKKSIMPPGQKTSHAAREHFWATPWCVPEDAGPEWERRGWWPLLLAFFCMNKCLAMSTDWELETPFYWLARTTNMRAEAGKTHSQYPGINNFIYYKIILFNLCADSSFHPIQNS